MAIAINAIIVLVLMSGATSITRTMGETALLVTEKVFGLIVLAIAIGAIVGALTTVFPGLAVAR